MEDETTICAPATTPGSGAIGIIRLSGPKAIAIADKVFRTRGETKSIVNQLSHTVVFGTIEIEGEILDEVLLTVFRKPHSYTGEDVVEISCHASAYIMTRLLQLLIKQGASMAKPGEFTQRAFLNGKMDLSQAEGVADLIASGSEAAHRIALNQMRGGFSKGLKVLRNELLHFISLIELELDFSEEDVEFADRKQLSQLIDRLYKTISLLVNSFEYGNAVKNGIPVAIIGRSNSGKSTLLNQLLHEEKAIVSEIAGTTRDFIEDTIVLNGFQFRFIDTAGLRHTTDVIETEGIQRTINKYKQASVVIILTDSRDDLVEIIKTFSFLREEGNELKKKVLIFALNKMDTLSEQVLKQTIIKYAYEWGDIAHIIPISAKYGTGIEQLEELLVKHATNKPSQAEVVVTNVRHFEALKLASGALERVMEGLKTSLPSDLLAQDIRETMHYLGEITGEITTDEILGNIFKNFCIGK